MANKPIVEDPDMDPVIRAVALFCATVGGDTLVNATSDQAIARARVFEEYIRTGGSVKKAKDRN